MKTLNLHLLKVALLHLSCPLRLGKGFCVVSCESSDLGRKWFAKHFSHEISCYLSHRLEFIFVGGLGFFCLKSLWLWQMLLYEKSCTTVSLADEVCKLCQFSEVENESANLKPFTEWGTSNLLTELCCRCYFCKFLIYDPVQCLFQRIFSYWE